MQKAIAGNWNCHPSHPEFIYGNNMVLGLYLSSAVSFIGLVFLVFFKSYYKSKYYRLSLVIYILGCTLCMSALAAHLFIGIDESTYTPTADSHAVRNLSLSDENLRSEEIEVQQEETTQICPLVDTFGIGIVHWYFNANKNCYVAFIFSSESEARLILQDRTVIEKPFNGYLADRDTYHFSGKNDTKGGFSLRGSGKYLTYRVKPSDTYTERAQYVGVAQNGGSTQYYPVQDASPAYEQGSSTNAAPAQRVCSLCNGKGWRAGNKTPVYEMGETYCSECGGYFPNSHSHDPCPSCQGRGYLNY